MKKHLLAALLLAGLALAASGPARAAADRPFGYMVRGAQEDIFFFTHGNNYLVQSEAETADGVSTASIVSSGSRLIFAAQDFTARRELTVGPKKTHRALVDEKDRKVVQVVYNMRSPQGVETDYELHLFFEIRREHPFLAIMSRFLYVGEGRRNCGINWAIDGERESYRFFTTPAGTFPLVRTRRSKIGQANWIFVNDGKGVGAGLIAPAALLGRGDDFIFLNSVPQRKNLARGQDSIELFMIFMPINRNFRVLAEIFEQIKEIRWEY